MKNRRESIVKKRDCKIKLVHNKEKELVKNKGIIRNVKETKQKLKAQNQQTIIEKREQTQQQKDMHMLIGMMKSKLAQNIEEEIY